MSKKVLWTESLKSFKGFLRPYFLPDHKFYERDGKLYVHKKIPIPWQSRPSLDPKRVIDLVSENENKIYKEYLCPFCGIEIKNEETTIRWTNTDIIPTPTGGRIFSDSHPFHIKCMKQARVFCPRMRDTVDSEYETGKFKDLRKNALDYINKYPHDLT